MSQPKQFSNRATILFMVILSVVCAVILSALASALAKPQELAKEIYRSKQMLVAAQIYNATEQNFQITGPNGKYVPAKAQKDGILVPGSKNTHPSQDDILAVYRRRIRPFLVDSSGKRHTFEEEKINEQDYLKEHKKRGYYLQDLKLIYELLSNSETNQQAEGYIIPVNGFGLWDAIYGYLAIKPDGMTVIGISWYEQKETPGLGANIADPPWQSLFPGKKIFQVADDHGDLSIAPVGITVVRGKVSEVYGDGPKAQSAVDGMAGATLTGNGVTSAYKDVLSAYRPFLIGLNKQDGQPKK